MLAALVLALTPLAPDVLVDEATTPAEREHVLASIAEARKDLAAAIGPLEAEEPLKIFCKTKECGRAVVGPTLRSCVLNPGWPVPGATYVPPRKAIALVHVGERLKSDVEHELTHVELYHRVPRGFPEWFHEGIATYVSDNIRCDGGPHRGVDDLWRLSDGPAWREYTDYRNALVPTYCQAKEDVAAWVQRHGRDKLIELLKAVRAGASFEAEYGHPPARRTTVVMSSTTELGAGRPFSLALWVMPVSASGVVTHLSDNPIGTGWCTPVLGFDASHRLVAQVPFNEGPDASHYGVAVAPKPIATGAWTHVALTWAPGGPVKLYVNGAKAAEAPAPTFYAPPPGPRVYATWGSYNLGGIDACWVGALTHEHFDGVTAVQQLFDRELSAAEIAHFAARL